MATVVTDQNFDEEVLQATVPVMVDFFAEWCGPCKMMAPIVDELASDYEGKAKIVKVDVDASPATAEKYGIMSIPTLVFFKGGDEQGERITGTKSKDDLVARLDGML